MIGSARVTRSLGWIVAAAALLLGAGCSASGPSLVDTDPAVGGGATLTVVVWSAQLQDCVRAVGTVTAFSDGTERVLDTSADPANGQTFTELPPGRYEVRIKFRKQGTSIEHVDGVGAIYLEPGATERLTVVVSDRRAPDDKLGRAPPGRADGLAAVRGE